MVQIKSLAIAGLAAVASARPAKTVKKDAGVDVGGQTCMTPDEAQAVATSFGLLISNYSNELADNALSVDYTDYSESVNTLINTCPQGSAAISLPLLAPTFSSRAQFETGQAQQPPINFQQLNIWPSCTSVQIRWTTNNTAPIANPKPVVGLISMEVIKNTNETSMADYPWSIDTVYSEFDSGAWLQNLQQAGICGPAPANSSAINDPTVSTSSAASAATCSCPAPSSGAPTAAPTSPATSTSAPVAAPTESAPAPSGSAPAPSGSAPSGPAAPSGSAPSGPAAPSESAPAPSAPAYSGPAAPAYSAPANSAPAYSAPAYAGSSASEPAAPAYTGSGSPTSPSAEDYTVTVVPIATTTSTVVVTVGPDGKATEEPCEEERKY